MGACHITVKDYCNKILYVNLNNFIKNILNLLPNIKKEFLKI